MGSNILKKSVASWWRSALVFVLGTAVSLIVWQALNNREKQFLASSGNQQVLVVQRELAARLDSRFWALRRLARWPGSADQPTRDSWIGSASTLYAQDGGYAFLCKLSPQGQLQWLVPQADQQAEAEIAKLLAMTPAVDARVAAQRENRFVVTRPMKLADGEKGFLVVIPVIHKDGFAGWIVGAYQTHRLLSVIFSSAALHGFDLAILCDDEVIYSTGVLPSAGVHKAATADLREFGLNWHLQLWVADAQYQSQQSGWPGAVLAVGLVMSALLALSVQTITVFRSRSQLIWRMNKHLHQEVRQRRQTERQLQQLTERLKLSNRELQDFASIASHDLQEPLRKIQAFGDRLASRCGDQLDQTGQDYLARMQNAAQRMGKLISDLLTYARISSKARPFLEVDLNEVVRGVISDLEVKLEQEHATVEVGDLPRLDADELQMRQLFQNLISNGLKFHKQGVPPVIKVTAALLGDGGSTAAEPASEGSASGGYWVQISVQDNGIGFDEKYLDRIFTVFQRLHGRLEYEGTGIGLSVCRKIAERHGGQITARSVPDEGACFVVTLPQKHVMQQGAQK